MVFVGDAPTMPRFNSGFSKCGKEKHTGYTMIIPRIGVSTAFFSAFIGLSGFDTTVA